MAIANVTQQEGVDFFKLGGRYLISPDSTSEALLNDANCLLDSAIGVLDHDFEALTSNQWAAFYLVQQAKAMQDRAIQILTVRKAFEPERQGR